MNGTTSRILGGFTAAVLLTPLIAPHATVAVTLEQVISREDPKFNCADAVLTVGRDGNVYLGSVVHNGGYILRVGRDGTRKLGGDAVYAMANATANAAGVVASANAHFNHSVTLYDPNLKQFAACNEFLVNDNVGWDAPAHVEAGASGHFYALDQHRLRIVRVSPAGKVVQVYPVPAEAKAYDLRVCEAVEAIYLRGRDGTLRCVGFDGAVRWTQKVSGAFAVDDAGTVCRLGPDGQEKWLARLGTESRLEPAPTATVTTTRDVLVQRGGHAAAAHAESHRLQGRRCTGDARQSCGGNAEPARDVVRRADRRTGQAVVGVGDARRDRFGLARLVQPGDRHVSHAVAGDGDHAGRGPGASRVVVARCALGVWDAAKEEWVFSQYLISDAPIHTHRLVTPVEAAKFRFARPDGAGWPASNLRLAEIVLHGETLGLSHPDAIRNRPVAVLFDERESDLNSVVSPAVGGSFQRGGAFSGGTYIRVEADKISGPAHQPPFGHAVPNWDFEIVEKPEKPGQYRWLQFAYKAIASRTARREPADWRRVARRCGRGRPGRAVQAPGRGLGAEATRREAGHGLDGSAVGFVANGPGCTEGQRLVEGWVSCPLSQPRRRRRPGRVRPDSVGTHAGRSLRQSLGQLPLRPGCRARDRPGVRHGVEALHRRRTRTAHQGAGRRLKLGSAGAAYPDHDRGERPRGLHTSDSNARRSGRQGREGAAGRLQLRGGALVHRFSCCRIAFVNCWLLYT